MKKLVVFLTSLFTAFIFAQSDVTAAPPANFQTSQIVGSGLDGPSGFAFAPDGRIFILERTGKVKIYKNGQVLPQPFVDLPSIATGDRGLIGIAFDPDFAANHYVYFYYTGLDKLNRLVRFDASGDTAQNGPFVMYQTTFPSELLHVGGSIAFGPDGKLYFAVGDNGYPPNAQMLNNPHGKILRINKDGTIPQDNPYVSDPSALPEIWAYGFRNPWRFQFDSETGKLYGGDVGDFSIEEVNHIIKGGNYGWPLAEGVCNDCSFINPIHAYPHANESAAVTGGPVYRGNLFPGEYFGSLFFADYAKGFIKRLTLDTNGNATGVHDFDMGAGSVVDLKVGTDGSLYYITYYPGRLYRITYSTDNHIPVAFASSDETKGTNPLTVNFSSNGSSDPDEDTLFYNWDFGDGTTSTAANPQKVFANKGTYTVQLTISDGFHSAQAVPIVIQVGIPPTVTIGTPKQNDKYKAGDTISYSAIAIDGAGFDINDAAIKTEVIFHHDTHIHPFYGPVPGRTGSFEVPLKGEPDPDVWYEIKVTATDTNGLSTTEIVEIFPEKSLFSLSSNIPGIGFFLDGIPVIGGNMYEGVVGYIREISTSFVQTINGIAYQFTSWSDGGLLKHDIAIADDDKSYVATFSETAKFKGEYFANQTLAGSPILVRNDAVIDFKWDEGRPDPSLPIDNFSVRWTATQNFPAGKYKFTTLSDDGVRLIIDGNTVIDKWIDQGSTIYSHEIDMSEGAHTIMMEYYEHTGGAVAKLSWDLVSQPAITPTPTPMTGSGKWSASYFSNMNLQGTPAVTRQVDKIDFDWADDSPDPAIPVNHFSARFSANETFSQGYHEFTLSADDGVRLYIDNELVIDKWIDQPKTTYTVTKELTAGTHLLKVEYYENYVGATVSLSYKPSTEVPTPTPTIPQGNGYMGKYWNYQKDTVPVIPNSSPVYEENVESIDFDWSDTSPNAAIATNHFIAQWTKKQQFDSGMYTFTTESDDGIRVLLDNKKIIDAWNDHAKQSNSVTVPVTAGEHEVKIEYYENYGDAIAKASYEKSGSIDGAFQAQYFNNITLSGTPVLTRDDLAISFQWFDQAPDALVPANHFSARWTKTKHFAAGEHSFTLRSDDGVRLFIDDQLLVDDWTDHPLKTYTPHVTLTEGDHTIKVEYYENYGDATIVLEEN